MISITESAQQPLSFTKTNTGVLNLCTDEIVPVKVLESLGGGFVKASVKGVIVKAFAAAPFIDLADNKTLQMTVSVKNGQIVLSLAGTENSGFSPPDVFSKLGVPRNDGTLALLSFFKKTGLPLNKTNFKKLSSILKAISSNQKENAFVLGLLADKNIPIKDFIVKKVFRAVYGKEDEEPQNDCGKDNKGTAADKDGKNSGFNENGNSVSGDTEFFKIINHKKGGKLHWLIFPFIQKLEEKSWKGSLALLLDLENSMCKTFALRCRSGEDAWLFSFTDKVCRFMRENCPPKEDRKEFELLVKECLNNCGLGDYSAVYGQENDELDFIPVDVFA